MDHFRLEELKRCEFGDASRPPNSQLICATTPWRDRRAYNPATFPLLGLLIRLVPWRENRTAL